MVPAPLAVPLVPSQKNNSARPIVAHRLSTIVQMDRIIVHDEGKIAEEGTHESLLKSGGLYAAFWARQSSGFIKTG